jgi:hypothetical protein
VRTRTKVSLLTSIAALTLGLGILLFAVVLRPSTETIAGTVVALAPGQLSVVIHTDDRTDRKSLRGRNVIVHLAPGQKVATADGQEELRLVLAGQKVLVTVRRGSFDAEQISVSGPGSPG